MTLTKKLAAASAALCMFFTLGVGVCRAENLPMFITPELTERIVIPVLPAGETVPDEEKSEEPAAVPALSPLESVKQGQWTFDADRHASFPNLYIPASKKAAAGDPDERKRRSLSSRGSAAGNGRYRQGYTNLTPMILKQAEKYNINPHIIRAVIDIESSYNPGAYSVSGACGLMQLKPGTALDMGVRDYWTPERNIEAGTKYLRLMLNKFGTLDLALAAYNQGPGTVERSGRKIPNATAKRYIQKFYKALEKTK